MGRNENAEPAEVVDRLLWRDAQQMLSRHAGPGPDDRCQWCGWEWPCPARRLAERADEASRRPWPDQARQPHHRHHLPQVQSAQHSPLPNGTGNLRPLPGGRSEPARPTNGRLFD